MKEQILIQHLLKLLAECEYDKSIVSVGTIASSLSISHVQAEQLLSDLRSTELIESDSITLTGSGREYAMHVLRAHRLYETYLARKTGVPESSWHKQADIREHHLTETEVQKLAEELGHPRFDPHGDPIPTVRGEMPKKRGKPLTDYPVGWVGCVVHIEDEPASLYARITKASIAPDTILRIEQKNANEVTICTEGRTFKFPYGVARQITAVDLAKGEKFDDTVERLSSLTIPGEQAAIIGLSPLCRGLERNRLLDLGMVPGTVVTVDLVNPSGSPIAYQLRGACIALRHEQAERIRIRKVR